LFVYNGLSVDSGAVDTTINTITGLSSVSLNWEILAKKDSSGLNLYTIRISGSNVELKDVNRGVIIPDLIPPAAPQRLSAVTAGNGKVRLVWSPNNENDLAGYKVYYSSLPTGFTGTDAKEGQSPIIVSTIDTFFVSGLTAGNTYRFALSAFDLSTNESSLSNEASVLVTGEQTSHWTINIYASVNGLQDSTAYAGADAQATDGFDSTFDLPKPPKPPSNFVYVYFPHSDWNSIVGPNFLADLQKDTNLTYTGKRWTFGVATDQGSQTMTLNFMLSSAIPWGYPVHLRDVKSDSVQDLRVMDTYTYNTGTDTLHMFQIIVGGPFTISNSFDAGWNMAGIPIKSTTTAKDSVLSHNTSTYLYGYAPNTGYYISNSFNTAQGFWLGALSPVTAAVTGVHVMDTVGIQLNPGFNIVSLPYFVPAYSKHKILIIN